MTSRKDSKSKGPTRLIIEMAQKKPGGVIRWHEARDQYLKGSEAARRNERKGERNYHMSLKQTLDRNFMKVEGANGFYVLRGLDRTFCLDNDGDIIDDEMPPGMPQDSGMYFNLRESCERLIYGVT